MLKNARGGELHYRRPIGFDWQGRGGSESGEESGSSESRVMQSAGLAFGSIAFEIADPEVTSNRSSSIGVIGSESMVETDVYAASKALFSGRAISCPSRQCGGLGCGSNPSKIKSPWMAAV